VSSGLLEQVTSILSLSLCLSLLVYPVYHPHRHPRLATANMVKLTLTPHRGNGARTFPSTGCLGMTPVTLAGVVRVKIEEDLKSVEASSLVVRVRCYESVDGGAPPPTTDASTSTGPSERASSSSGYHSSSCLGGSSSNPSGYSISDILRGGASSSTSANGNNAKGRVLYEKSVQMWSPPSPSTSSKKSDSATQSSSSTSSSRSSSLERSLQHAYPPRSREVSHSSSLSSTIPSASSSTSSQSNVLQYATLGEFTKAWRIVIPINAIEKGGAKSTMIYKNWRIWWTVEAGMFFFLFHIRSPPLESGFYIDFALARMLISCVC
jgi:hypothetical protein